MKVTHTSNGIIIIISDITFLTPYVTSLAAFWNGSLLIMYFLILISGTSGKITFFIMTIPFLLAGFYLIYMVALQWFNKIYIFANDEVITIDYKPIPHPWFRNKIIKIKKIEKLYLQKTLSNENYTYHLRALMKSGSNKKLLNFLPEDKAYSIQNTLEKNLDIEIKFRSLSGKWH